MHLPGKNIFLRTVVPADAPILYTWENDETIWPVSGTERPFTQKEIDDFVVASQKDIYLTKQLRLMICCKGTGNRTGETAVGCIDLFDFDSYNHRAGVGILIADKKHRRKGFASEALSMLIEHSHSKLHLSQLYCNILSTNRPSIKLFEKHKFASENAAAPVEGERTIHRYVRDLMNNLP